MSDAEETSPIDHRQAFVIVTVRRLADWYAKFHMATLGDGDQADPITIIREALDSQRDHCAALICKHCDAGRVRTKDNEYHYEDGVSQPRILAGRCTARSIWNA